MVCSKHSVNISLMRLTPHHCYHKVTAFMQVAALCLINFSTLVIFINTTLRILAHNASCVSNSMKRCML